MLFYKDNGRQPLSNIETLIDLSPSSASVSNRTVPMTPLDVGEDWARKMIHLIKDIIKNDLQNEDARKVVADFFGF